MNMVTPADRPAGPRSNTARILEILAGFDDANTPRRVAELLAEAGISRSTGFSLIQDMSETGWLERVRHGWVRLGPAAKQLIFSPLGARYAALSSVNAAAITLPAAERPSTIDAAADWNPTLVEKADTAAFARPGPYRLGFANASLSNDWRAALVCSMLHSARRLPENIDELLVRHADDDPIKQILQIDELVASGIDLLLVSAASVTDEALSEKLRSLVADGLPVICVDRRAQDLASMVSFVTASDATIGRASAVWLAEHIGGKGRIWLLSGLSGASPAIRRQAEALKAFAEFPDIQVEAFSPTGWTAEGGRSAVENMLDQFGSAPDGVWSDSGLQGVGSIEAFLARGIKAPPHTGGDLNKMYKLAIYHKIPFAAVDYPAAMGARAVETALEILAGRPVPKRVETETRIVMPRGCETSSVKADEWAERHVRWDLPDDAVLSQGPSLKVYHDQKLQRELARVQVTITL